MARKKKKAANRKQHLPLPQQSSAGSSSTLRAAPIGQTWGHNSTPGTSISFVDLLSNPNRRPQATSRPFHDLLNTPNPHPPAALASTTRQPEGWGPPPSAPVRPSGSWDDWDLPEPAPAWDGWGPPQSASAWDDWGPPEPAPARPSGQDDADSERIDWGDILPSREGSPAHGNQGLSSPQPPSPRTPAPRTWASLVAANTRAPAVDRSTRDHGYGQNSYQQSLPPTWSSLIRTYAPETVVGRATQDRSHGHSYAEPSTPMGRSPSPVPTTPVSVSRREVPPEPEDLKRLAEDVSILLEIYSKSNSENEDESRQLIEGALESISKIHRHYKVAASQRGQQREVPQGSDDIRIDAGCIICYSEVADTVLIPCNHLVLCASCCDVMGIQGKGDAWDSSVPCPICRRVVRDRIKVFRC